MNKPKSLHSVTNWALAVALFFGVVLVGVACGSGSSTTVVDTASNSVTPEANSDETGSVPDFELVDLDGNKISLSDFDDKVVVLDFFASWCTTCNREASEVNNAYKEWKDQGVEFIGVAIFDNENDSQNFVDKHSISFPVAISNSNIQREYGVTGVPEKVFISKDRTTIQKTSGFTSKDSFDSIIASLLES